VYGVTDFKSIKHCLDLFFVFSLGSITCLKKPVFSKAGSSAVEGTSQGIF
jgi:hypothetical protein